MLFKKKEDLNLKSIEYEILNKKFIETVSAVEELKIKFEALNTNMISLRQSVNKHRIKKIEEDDTDNNKNPNVFLNPYGIPLRD